MERSSPSNTPFLGFNEELYSKYFTSETCDPYHEWLGLPKGVQRGYFSSFINEIAEDVPFLRNRSEVIVSLTSHPKRISTAWLAIESIMRQTHKPERIVLNLMVSDFGESVCKARRSLPPVLTIMEKRGLEINFTDTNYYVATKLIPTLIKYPCATIITIDDDRIYSNKWLKKLLKVHKKYPEHIVCPHVRRYCFRENLLDDIASITKEAVNIVIPSDYPCITTYHTSPIDYQKQRLVYDEPIFGIFEGFAGVLYPSGSLHLSTLDLYRFLTYTPVADDIWFQVMAIKIGTKCVSPTVEQTREISFCEIDGTQEEGLFRQHLQADDVMAYECMRHYNVLDIIRKQEGLKPLKCYEDIICGFCMRYVRMDKPVDRKKITCKGCLSMKKRVILCVGAYDYGNIGDNIYKNIFSHELCKRSFDVVTCPDSVLMDPHRKYIPCTEKVKEFIDYDILVIGGGGILKNFSGGIKWWLENAIERGKPFFFISVGFQDHVVLSQDTIDLLNKAEFITVRSNEDYKLLKTDTLTYVVRDMGYLYSKMVKIKTKRKKYVTLIQTGTCNVNQSHVRDKIDKLLDRYKGSKLLVMNWGGVEYPGKTPDYKEYDTFVKVKEYYPRVKVLFGDTLSEKLQEDIHPNKVHRKSDLTPIKALEYIEKSHYVLTGRYHGLVLSKSLQVPCESLIFTHKLKAESVMEDCNIEKVTHIDMLVSYIQSSGWIYKWRGWSDSDRNTMICKVHDDTGVSIPFLQAMDNRMLFEIIVGLRNI